MALLACPFCRELYSASEAEVCPMCALPLTAAHKLPKARGFDPADAEAPLDEADELVPWTSLGRGRGPLLGLAACGLAAFFLPWIDLTFPMVAQLSGFDLSQRLGWTWAVPAAWFVLVPVVLSRRTAHKMQSARVAAGMLAFFPGMSAVTLLRNPPKGSHGIHPELTFLWPMYATIGLSAVAVVTAAFFGLAWRRRRPWPAMPHETEPSGANPGPDVVRH